MALVGSVLALAHIQLRQLRLEPSVSLPCHKTNTLIVGRPAELIVFASILTTSFASFRFLVVLYLRPRQSEVGGFEALQR
ncbi:hypothetical protein DL95DRAFT_111585 [Leptodontidium sp. 2 PMI_412]|nr:hypothetical protein DL95DRAFT_111585 [Leptodontidium sp. 2 PMI_412]